MRNSILLLILLVFGSCGQRYEKAGQTESDLLTGFQNPPAEARPFVRWWWNGNRIEKEEIVRQLNVLHEAGIGGVEINPIAMPNSTAPTGPMVLKNCFLKLTITASNRGSLTFLMISTPVIPKRTLEDSLINLS